MGAWGAAIFSDDTAADTRDAFLDYIAEGLSPAEATERLTAESADILADQDDGAVFWLALAATQWKSGRLMDSVRDRAIGIIDSGADLRRWQEGGGSQLRSRAKHLERLRERLLSPQPKQTKVKAFQKSSTDFLPGDVAAFRLDERTAIRFCVLDLWADRGGTYSNICLLGLDDGWPFEADVLTLTDTLGPHYTMVSHEPAERITLLRRGVRTPERNVETFHAWHRLPVHGHFCRWEDFSGALRDVLPKLGWS